MYYRPIAATRIRSSDEDKPDVVRCARCGRKRRTHNGRLGVVCRDCRESMSEEENALWQGISTGIDWSAILSDERRRAELQSSPFSSGTPSSKDSPRRSNAAISTWTMERDTVIRPAGDGEIECLQTHKLGFLCTRAVGHLGDHVAHIEDDVIVRQWRQVRPRKGH